MTLDDFRTFYMREHATTRKVLHAYPADRADFTPHERANPARQLAWLFVGEERMVLRALRGEPILGSGFPEPPNSWQEVLDAFDAVHADVVQALDGAEDGSLAPVTFFTAPKTMGEYAALDFIWFMICDQIHHRGQLSVYLRMTGSKVPSIYGPSADEPWT